MLAVPPEQWAEFEALCRAEGVEATIIGEFVPTGRLQLMYRRATGGRLVDGVPARRPAAGRARGGLSAAADQPLQLREGRMLADEPSITAHRLLKILGSLNVCSKEWVIRQYDHEVQGGSVIKPLVGVAERRPERRRGAAAGARLRGAASSLPAA